MTFAIVNLRKGTQRDVAPFLLDNDAFPVLENAYLFRGRIQRRSAVQFVGNDGRLQGNYSGMTDGGGNFVQTLEDAVAPLVLPTGVSEFEVTGIIGGNPATFTLTDPGGASPVNLLSTNGSVTATLNRSAAANHLSIGGLDAATAISIIYYPSLPVMGLEVYEQSELNDEDLFAFDTRYAYTFNPGTNFFQYTSSYAGANRFVWTGSDSDFFWSTNYYDAFWVTNGTPGLHATEFASTNGDGIRWYGNVSGVATGWVNFNPIVIPGGTPIYLTGAKIILPYKDRLVVLNTYEGNTVGTSVQFPQRARWSQNGTPFYNSFPVNGGAVATSWDETVTGRGGFIDAPTQEHIVSAQFIKDTLVVYFERSTWQLVYTGNELIPFIWKQINNELGCESTFSTVGFDSGVFAAGNYGIISTDSVSVARIDQNIPDEVFRFQNKNMGLQRVHGIRDYSAQLVYWTFPVSVDEDNQAPTYNLTYPNQVLVYNYLDGSWAEFDDSFTCFGYWQQSSDITWAQLNRSWQSSNFAWNSEVLQSRFPDVIAGNQRGFVFTYSQIRNIGQNDPSIPISNFTPPDQVYAPNHNFVPNDYVYITGAAGVTNLNGNIYRIESTTDENNFVIDTSPYTPLPAGTYTGDGLITHMPNFEIRTKEFNPFYQNGKSVRLNYFDIYIDRTDEGEITAQTFTESNDSLPIEEMIILTSPESQVLTQNNQVRIFHRNYSNAFGSFFQNVFTLNDTQMRDIDITTSNVKIHGIIYYTNEAGRISYDL